MAKIVLTGATGTMGSMGLKEILKDPENVVTALVLPRERECRTVKEYADDPRVKFYWGDLTDYDAVCACVEGCDIVLHVGALVSPAADNYPELAMRVNYGSTVNIIRAIKETGGADRIRLVYIGTVAETGDRMPPIHWERVGDPVKPSVHDYYAVSKVAAERAVIESGLKYWVSLRQTGILSKHMADIEDGIIFHNCLDNVLEYVTDYDSGVLLRNVCKTLPDDFWCHIYNIGGGESCRASFYTLLKELFRRIGITNLDDVFEGKWFATRNFHGSYYLDGDRLNKYLRFRSGSLEYFYRFYMQKTAGIVKAAKIITRIPCGCALLGSVIKRRFRRLAGGERGTMNFIKKRRSEYIEPFFISEHAWKKIPRISRMTHFTDWDKVVRIDHGYDETKPESELSLADLKQAAAFRGGECLSKSMTEGDMRTPLTFRCAFGHAFTASPRLVLEGGHWCPVCERESWNYQKMAEVNPFFAQVWYPLHDRDEEPHTYPKIVSELDAAEPSAGKKTG